MNPVGPDSVYILLVQPDLYNSLFHMRPPKQATIVTVQL